MSASYLDHFGLRQAPFGMAPDLAFVHHSQGFKRVLDWIEDGIAARAPVFLLTGAAGTGKTTLLKLLLDRHGGDWTLGLVSAAEARPDTILVQARRAFGLPDQGDGSAQTYDQIRRLAETVRSGGGFTVLVVDDAQALKIESMSALASLAMSRGEGGALTLLLAGRPELRRLLAIPTFRSLRIAESPRAVLTPFSAGDTAGYVAHRLAQSGARMPVFDAGAMQVLHFFALGVPRLINTMADHCLAAAAAQGLSHLDAAWVGDVLRKATTAGEPSHPEEPAAQLPQPVPRGAPGMPEALGIPERPAALDTAGALDRAAPPALTTVPDLALASGTPLPAGLREDPGAWQAAPFGRERRNQPVPRSGALRSPEAAPLAVAAPAHRPSVDLMPLSPLSPPRGPEPRQRMGLWFPAMAAVLAGGAVLAWFQPWQATAPAATDLAPASAPAPAAAKHTTVAPAPGPPALSPGASQSPAPVAVTPDPTPAALMAYALEVETHDPAQAAIAYARAAIRGRARAAYFLGQLYETGAGVEPSPGLARLWYAAAGLPAAQQRLRALSAAENAFPGSPAPPLPIFQARLSTSGSEMIWRVPEGVAPIRFRVEIFGPAQEPLPAQETTVPGLIVPFPVSAWRVIAIGADGTESLPSALVRMVPAGQ